MTTLNSGMSYEDYLEHYGVKGMRWGRRRASSDSSSSASDSTPKKAKKVKPAKPDVKSMSDEELRKRLNRLQMEQQYAKLTGTPAGKSKLERGKDVYKKTMTIIETGNKIYGAYNSPAGKIIREQVGGTETGKKVQAEIAKQLISVGLKK